MSWTLPLLRLATWSTVGPCSLTPPWGRTGSSVVRNQSKDNPDYSSMPYKYAERNVRGLALVVTAQERSDVDNIDLDNVRFNENQKNSETFDDNSFNDYVENPREADEAVKANEDEAVKASEENANDDEAVKIKENKESKNAVEENDDRQENVRNKDEVIKRANEASETEERKRLLPPTSTGRIRKRPKNLIFKKCFCK